MADEASTELKTSYQYQLILGSYAVCVMGAYTGLQLIDNVKRAATAKTRTAWLWGSATAIGFCGIWSMHFIGMVALNVEDTSLRFEVPITMFSGVVSVVVTFAGLWMVAGRRMGETDYAPVPLHQLLLAGTTMGFGVTCMHFSGMRAVRGNFVVRWNPAIIAAGVIVGVCASIACLGIMFNLRGRKARTISAFVIGLGACAMHYTAMEAMTYYPVDPNMDVSKLWHVERPGEFVTDVHGLGMLVLVVCTVIRLLLITWYTMERAESLTRIKNDLVSFTTEQVRHELLSSTSVKEFRRNSLAQTMSKSPSAIKSEYTRRDSGTRSAYSTMSDGSTI